MRTTLAAENKALAAAGIDAELVKMSARMEVLQRSLERKQAAFDARLSAHFDAVRATNGQPLNDKRNGAATLRQWERQNDALRSAQAGIEVTQAAIEREAETIERVAAVELPAAIQSRIDAGELSQRRKHPNTFFVTGVGKARIVLRPDGQVAHRYARCITDPEQRRVFARVYNAIHAETTAPEAAG